uniref:RcnB family protein n=1 Tax=Parastrongyloides trichosuri TaxID=131310 RepID=A0A0N4Z6I1_PARTI
MKAFIFITLVVAFLTLHILYIDGAVYDRRYDTYGSTHRPHGYRTRERYPDTYDSRTPTYRRDRYRDREIWEDSSIEPYHRRRHEKGPYIIPQNPNQYWRNGKKYEMIDGKEFEVINVGEY